MFLSCCVGFGYMDVDFGLFFWGMVLVVVLINYLILCIVVGFFCVVFVVVLVIVKNVSLLF